MKVYGQNDINLGLRNNNELGKIKTEICDSKIYKKY